MHPWMASLNVLSFAFWVAFGELPQRKASVREISHPRLIFVARRGKSRTEVTVATEVLREFLEFIFVLFDG